MFQLQLCRHLCINNVISNFYRRVGGGKPEKRWGEMHFNCYANPQGWLPPCYLSVVVAGSVIHGHTLGQPDQSKIACQLPPPQDRAEQIMTDTRAE